MTYYHDFIIHNESWLTVGNLLVYSAFTQRKGSDIRNKVEKGYLWSSVRSGLPILSVDTLLTCRQEPTDSRATLLSSLLRTWKIHSAGKRNEEKEQRQQPQLTHRLHQWFGIKTNYLFAQQSWQSIFTTEQKIKVKIFTTFSFTWALYEEDFERI